MTNKLICPFCGKSLSVAYNDGVRDFYWCENYDDPHTGNSLVATKETWQLIIKLRKQLIIAKIGLEQCKTRDHVGAICRIPEYVDKVFQAIDKLEEGDVDDTEISGNTNN